ncbi:SgcJ/EcaC family oxidoreductase [bacterium]|nr:SgcJ/EcaC family oxidoreductase [bacterium]
MPTEVRNAIAATNAKFLQAFRQGDAAGLAATYTSNGQALPTNSDIITGKTALQGFWQAVLDMGIKSGTLDTVELDDCGDTVIEIGKYTLQVSGGQTVDEGKYLVVWKQEDGQWKWHRDIWNSSMPAPE